MADCVDCGDDDDGGDGVGDGSGDGGDGGDVYMRRSVDALLKFSLLHPFN